MKMKPIVLKYDKNIDFDFTPIKEIHAERIALTVYPKWLQTL